MAGRRGFAGSDEGFRIIGQPMPVFEDRRFVRGKGHYINDLELPRMLHVGLATSPVAHANLVSVNVSAALAVPGVVAVITGADAIELMQEIPQDFLNLPDVHWYPLAVDKIRVAGEWIAAVVAESRAIAEDAAELVEFEFDELEPVVDPELAILPESPVLHEQMGHNIAWHEVMTWGDVDAELQRADHTFSYRYRWHRHSGVPIETFGAVAAPGPNQVLDVWASHQNPGIQQEMMEVLRLPTVRVNMDIDVGGSYGSKRGKKQMYIAALAALTTGRPCKFIEDRLENMISSDGHGPDRIYKVTAGANGDGLLTALDIEVIEDLGAYGGRGNVTKPVTAICGPYNVKNIRYGGYIALTCKTNQVPFRGAGQSPHNFVLERTMDHIADELGIDKVEIRRRNYIEPDEFPYRTPSGAIYDSGNYPGAMDLLIDKADLPALRDDQAKARAEGRLVGIGICGCVEPSGAPRTGNVESARIQIDPHGRVIVGIGFQSCGQAHESMVAQIVSEEFGVEPGAVIVQRINGLGGIVGGAPTGSRMTLMLGSALKAAAVKLQKRLVELAAQLFEIDPGDIVVDGRSYQVTGDPDSQLSLSELARAAYSGSATLPAGFEPSLVADATSPGPQRPRENTLFPSYAFDFHAVMVEVDPETFQIEFKRYVIVHDCGTVMNPLVVDGFVYGGVGHGIGGALYENFAYDDRGGLQAATFMDYLLPTAAEVPHVELHTMVTLSPLHPYGAKGTAEGSYMTTPAVVASAIEDALAPLGLKIDEVPVTPLLMFDGVAALNQPRQAVHAGPDAR